MNLENNLVSLIDILGFAQGVIIGVVILVLNKGKSKAKNFLGSFILLWGFQFLIGPLEALGINKAYPKLLFLPIHFTWILMPLFFIYIQRTSIFSNDRTGYWLLLPGLLSLFIQLYLFYLPVDLKLEIKDSKLLWAFHLAGAIYALNVCFYCIYYVYRHIQEIKNHYSAPEYKELKWTAYFSSILAIIILILIKRQFIPDNWDMAVFFSCLTLGLIYWVSIQGLRQNSVAALMPVEQPGYTSSKLKKNDLSESANQKVSDNKLQEIVEQANGYIKASEAFTNKELTITEIAEGLHIHPRRISTAINTVCNQNFNAYINKFRVDKALELIEKNKTDHLSIEGLGTEVGFHSKSAFYSAFKKHTNTTPMRYMEKVL